MSWHSTVSSCGSLARNAESAHRGESQAVLARRRTETASRVSTVVSHRRPNELRHTAQRSASCPHTTTRCEPSPCCPHDATWLHRARRLSSFATAGSGVLASPSAIERLHWHQRPLLTLLRAGTMLSAVWTSLYDAITGPKIKIGGIRVCTATTWPTRT